jgi:hypothetical protein
MADLRDGEEHLDSTITPRPKDVHNPWRQGVTMTTPSPNPNPSANPRPAAAGPPTKHQLALMS